MSSGRSICQCRRKASSRVGRRTSTVGRLRCRLKGAPADVIAAAFIAHEVAPPAGARCSAGGAVPERDRASSGDQDDADAVRERAEVQLGIVGQADVGGKWFDQGVELFARAGSIDAREPAPEGPDRQSAAGEADSIGDCLCHCRGCLLCPDRRVVRASGAGPSELRSRRDRRRRQASWCRPRRRRPPGRMPQLLRAWR